MRKLAILLLICGAAPAAADFSFLGLKNSLVDFALEQISVPGELELSAEGVEDSEDGATDIVGLTVADGDGPWLTIERLSLRWNPTRILRGELEIGRLAATGVDVLRAPGGAATDVTVKEDAAIAETDDEPFDWPRSPIAMRVEELALTRVAIAAGVIAEQSLAFDARGAARDEGDEQSVALTLTRSDDVAGRIDLDFLRDFAADALTLKLDAEEAPGGLVAALAGFPPSSASIVKLDADGPLTDWRLDFEAAVDDVFAANGEARIEAVDRIAAKANFTLRPGPALDEAVRTALSPEARLTVDVAEDETGLIAIRSGALTAQDLTLTAAGTFDRNAAALDVQTRLEARAGLADLAPGVEFERIAFEGALTGPLDDLAADGRIDLAGLQTAAADVAAASLAAKVTVAGSRIGAVVDGDAEGMRIDRIGPDILGAARLRLEAALDGDAAELATLRLTSPALTLNARGRADIAGNEADLTYALTAPDLAPLTAAYGVDAAGAFAADGALSGPLDAPRLVGDLMLDGLAYQGEPYGAVTLAHDAVLDETPEGSASLRAEGSRYGPLTFDGDFALDGAALALTDLEATALGALVKGAVDVDLDQTLIAGEATLIAPDLTAIGDALGEEVSGAVDGRIVLDAAEGRQSAKLAFAAAELSAFGAAIASGDFSARIADALGDPSVTGEAALGGFRGFGAAVRSAKLSGGASALLGDDPTFDAAFAADGVTTDGAEVERIEGAAKGAVSKFDARVRVLRAAAGAASLASLDAKLTAEGAATPDPRIALTARAESGAAGDIRISRADLSARGPLSALRARLSARGEGPGDEPLALDAEATAKLDGADTKAVIYPLAASFGESETSLRRPLRIDVSDGTTRLADIDLALPGGGLTGDAALHSGGASGDLALTIADLTPLADLAGAPVERGALDLAARFDTRRASPSAKVKAAVADLRFKDVVADIGALALDAALDWNGRQADLTAALSGPFAEPFRAALTIPLRPSGGAVPAPPKGGQIAGNVNWRGDIGEFWALVPAPGHVLAGDTRIALTVGGALDQPTIGGEVAIDDGRYENLDIGTILVDLSAASRIEPDGAFAIDLSANDGAGGPVTARAALKGDAIDAKIEASGATLVRRDDVTAAISLDIAATGPLAGPRVAGRIGVDRAEVRLVAAAPPGVADLGPVRIKGAPVEEDASGAGDAVSLDLKIEGPRDIFVRGRGLDSEWSIDLAVTGTAAEPRINGAIEKRRGVLTFLGAPLDLARGEIRFFDRKVPDPTLDILLEREKDGVTGGIAVTGSASAPAINFVSRPTLPEDEVLPRILFGRSQQSLSPSEAVSLAIGLSTLFDGSGGSVDGVRSAVGLDVLRIEDGGDGAAVTVGSNIVDGVFVGAKQPIDGGSASVQVEIEVFDDFTIDSETGADTGTSIGLNWKRDF